MNNFTNNRWLSVITLLLLTANIVTLTLLWTHKSNGRSDIKPPSPSLGGQAFEFLTHELKLDSAQQEAYKKLSNEHRARQRELQDSIGKAKDNFFELLQQENVTDSLLKIFSRKVGELEQQRDILTFKHFQKLRALCNKEQQIKFDSIIQEVLKHMGPAKRPQGPPPPGMDDPERRPPGMENGDRKPPPH